MAIMNGVHLKVLIMLYQPVIQTNHQIKLSKIFNKIYQDNDYKDFDHLIATYSQFHKITFNEKN